ncbi:MAG: hypothetical protein Q9182_004199 [Xanthomendoza sp. 2 TL-2023]
MYANPGLTAKPGRANEKVPPLSVSSHNSRNTSQSYQQLLKEAREQYFKTVPPFAFAKRWLKDGHRYEAVLASPEGQHPRLPALMTRKALVAVKWNTEFYFWTLEAEFERWIVALVNPIFTEPDHQIAIPYNRWLGVGQGVNGFSDHPVAFLAPTDTNELSYPEFSSTRAARPASTTMTEHSALLGPAIRSSVAKSLQQDFVLPQSVMSDRLALNTSTEPKGPKRRFNQNHTFENSIRKKYKALHALGRTVDDIVQQDREWYRNLSIVKPPFVTRKDTLATAKKVPHFTAFLADAEGQCTPEQIQVYGRDYTPAFLYWVANIAGGERIVIKSIDTQGGIYLRLWLGHYYGTQEAVVAYGSYNTNSSGLPFGSTHAKIKPLVTDGPRPLTASAHEDHPISQETASALGSDSEGETFVSAHDSVIQKRDPSMGSRALVQNPREQLALPHTLRSSNPNKSAFTLPLIPLMTTSGTGSDRFCTVSGDQTDTAQKQILGAGRGSPRAAVANRQTHWQQLREKTTREETSKQPRAIDVTDERNAYGDDTPADATQPDVREVDAVGNIESQIAATTASTSASTSPLPDQTGLQPPASHHSASKRGEVSATTTESPGTETLDSNPVESTQQHSLTLQPPTTSSMNSGVQAPTPTPASVPARPPAPPPQHSHAKKAEMERRKRQLRRELVLLELADIEDDERSLEQGSVLGAIKASSHEKP